MKTGISQEQAEQLLTDYAYGIGQYLKDVGCIREADNVLPPWASTKDMCGAVGAPVSYWASIREKMIELDIPLALANYGGYYLGDKGEQATLINHKTRMLYGIAASCNGDIMMIAKSSKTMKEVKEYAEAKGIKLADIPKVLRVLGHPLEAQIEVLLIEAGKEET